MSDERRRWHLEIAAIILSSFFHAGIEYVIISFVIPLLGIFFSIIYFDKIALIFSSAIFIALIACYFTWVFTQLYHQKKDVRIASQFSDLHDAFRPFEQMIIHALFVISCSNGKINIDEEIERIADAHTKYLANICVTASVVLGAKKGRKIPLSANIKTIHINEKREKLYSFLVSSAKEGSSRFEYENTLRDREIKIDSNYMYKRMFNESIIRTYYYCADVNDIFESIKNGGEIVEEPNTHSAKQHRSFLIYPIFGNVELKSIKSLDNPKPNSFGGKELILYKDKEVFGLLCVDSPKTRAFNLDYDLAVMRQLTSYAFESFRMVRAVQETAKSLSREKDKGAENVR